MKNIYLTDGFFYLLALIVVFLAFYLIGRCLLRVVNMPDEDNPYAVVFNSVLISLSLSISVFAVIITRFNTIMLIGILLLLMLFFMCKSKGKENVKFSKKELGDLLFSFFHIFVSFVLFYFFFFYSSDGCIWGDQIYYSNASANILNLHTETTRYAQIDSSPTMYHWGDIWMTAMFLDIFDKNVLHILCLVTYPLMLGMLLIGLCAFLYDNKLFNNIFVIIFLLVGFVFYRTFISFFIDWQKALIHNPKFLLPATYFMWSIFCLVRKKYLAGYIIILLIVPFYTPLAPGALSFVVIHSICTYSSKNIIRKLLNPYILLSVGIAIFFLLFYCLQFYLKNSSFSAQESSVFLYNNPVKDALMFLTKRSVRSFCCFLVPLIVLVLLNKKQHQNLVFVDYIYIAISLLLSSVFSNLIAGVERQVILDGGQIASNFLDISVGVFGYLTIVVLLGNFFLRRKFILVYIYICVVIFYPFYYFYKNPSPIYCYNQVENEKEQEFYSILLQKINFDDARFGYFRNYQLPKNHNTQRTRYCVILPIDKLSHFMNRGYYSYCLSVLDMPNDILPMWSDYKSSQLYKFAKECGMENKNDIILGFMKDRNINYIIIEENVDVPPYLAEYSTLVAEYAGEKVFHVCL